MPTNNGNKALPVERKRALGNPGHQKLPKLAAVSVLPVASVDAPAHLGDVGRAAYLHVVSTCPWVGASDVFSLVKMCEMLDEVAVWQRDIEARGMVLETPNGTLQAHPLIAHVRDARKQIFALASLLGLSPSDRGRIGAGEVQAKSKLQALIDAEKRSK